MTMTFEMNDASSPDSGRIVLLSDLLLLLGISSTATTLETDIARAALTRAEGAVIRHLRYDPVMSVRTEYYPNQGFHQQGTGVWEANDTEAYFRRQSSGSSSELQVLGLPVRELDFSGENPIDLRIDYDGKAGTRSGSFGSETLKVVGVDFWPNYDFLDSATRKVCLDGIIRSEGLWPQTPGSVKIAYVAGYTAGELAGTDSVIDASPIQEAVLDEATRRVHKYYSRMKKSRVGFGVGGFTGESLGDYSYTSNSDSQKELISGRSELLAETIMKLEAFVNWGAMLSS